jgi:hypothetical protein
MADGKPIFVTGTIAFQSHRGSKMALSEPTATPARLDSGCPFWGKVEELLKTGKAHSRGAAVKMAARQFPELHEQFLAAQRRQESI